MPRGTPLYGQPSWWGDDEADEQRPFKSNGKPEEKNHETGTSGKKSQIMTLNGFQEELTIKAKICLFLKVVSPII